MKREKGMSSTTKKDQVQDHIERGKDAVGNATERVKEEASSMMDKVKDTASQAGQAVGNVATTVGHKAEDATSNIGSGMQNLGKKVREKGPESGFLGKASESVAGALEQGGRYLEEKNLSGMADDLTSMIKRNPVPAVLIGIGLGFLLARTMRS
jgi:phage-related protein